MNDLIRQAIAAEADDRVDSRTVLANLHKRKKAKPFGMIIGVATLTVAAAAAAVIIPTTIKKTDAQPASPPADGAQNVLLIGTDDQRIADAIVFARFEADGSAAIISLPRDIYAGSSPDKLNSLFRDDPRRLTAAVEDLTGVKVDHYAAVQMSEFGRVATAVGGIDVCLNNYVHDPYSGAHFMAGRQTLVGEQALQFLRQRHDLPGGDLDRVRRQQAFLTSFATKITKDNAPELLQLLERSIAYDEGWDLLKFSQRFTGPVKVRSATLPVGEMAQRGDITGYEPDPGQSKQFVADQFGGKGSTETGCVN
ncbi:LCP family protein [Lentzea sp. NPDC058436]|uniref:LCP family protein n=1 Tax=Lentzea sp. NPDC058436 TaxID=3346499 RepID=UPI00365830AC